MTNNKINVSCEINADILKVWECFNGPEHIVKWNAASDDWHTPVSEVDLREGGSFKSRMEAKDGSFGFDFIGFYQKIVPNSYISYKMEDDRKVIITFESAGQNTILNESFDPENENPAELQQQGWQAILDNFKKYVEGLN